MSESNSSMEHLLGSVFSPAQVAVSVHNSNPSNILDALHEVCHALFVVVAWRTEAGWVGGRATEGSDRGI